MHTHRKFWFTLIAASLGLAFIACACPALTPTPTSAPLPTSASARTVVVPPATQLPATIPPASVPSKTVAPATEPPASGKTPSVPGTLPDLAGYWQEGSRVYAIQLQGGKFLVTGINSPDSGTRTLTNQSWDGTSLTWSYIYTDQSGEKTITFSSVSQDGDKLTANFSSDSDEKRLVTLLRVNAFAPDYYSLPYHDDFSNPNSGWSIFSTDSDSAGYGNGTYIVISKTNQYSSYGSANRFFGNTVIDVDATPVSGPPDDNFSYNVGCRNQSNGDGYIFEVEGDGFYAVGYYTGDGSDYTSLLGGSDDWLSSDVIKQGLVTNHLTVTCAGDQLSLAINGQKVFVTKDSTFIEGDLSLGAATYDDNNVPVELHFDNLEVSAP